MGHIKINDLSVGDWVMYEGSYRKVALIDGVNGLIKFALSPNFVGTGGVEPIPITPEIMDKHGKYSSDYKAWCIGGRAVVSSGQGTYHVHIYDCHISQVAVMVSAKYIHQLQHSLRLAGITKEIEL